MSMVDHTRSYRRIESSFEFAGGPSSAIGRSNTVQFGSHYLMPTPGSTYRMEPLPDRPQIDRGVTLPKLKFLETQD